MQHIGLGVAALALAGMSAPPAMACGWLWACNDRAYASRKPPAAYGYRPGYRRPAWSYGYTSPARIYGYPYAAWPSTSIPPSRWYLGTAPSEPNADRVGLTAPISSAQGLQQAGLPARGPSLFGPSPAPVAGYYYYAPAYGYYSAPAYDIPPRNTPSWWLEPRRRR